VPIFKHLEDAGDRCPSVGTLRLVAPRLDQAAYTGAIDIRAPFVPVAFDPGAQAAAAVLTALDGAAGAGLAVRKAVRCLWSLHSTAPGKQIPAAEAAYTAFLSALEAPFTARLEGLANAEDKAAVLRDLWEVWERMARRAVADEITATVLRYPQALRLADNSLRKDLARLRTTFPFTEVAV
jgi:hypothetical protein